MIPNKVGCTRNHLLKLVILTFLICYFEENLICQFGLSFSASIDKALGFNVFYSKKSNSFFLGFSEQLSDKKNTVVKERKWNYGLTPIGSGEYYWTIDFGYSRKIKKRLNLQPEISLGSRNYYTNYSDKRFKDGGYTLITSSEAIIGLGLNAGIFFQKIFEPFLGYHTIKKLNFGIRIHF
jgi:hypothetical protein